MNKIKQDSRAYISGPMTGIPQLNFPEFNRVAAIWRDCGYEVINPAEKGIIEGWDWEDYLRYDIRDLCTCTTIVLLKDWHESRGARLEYNVARDLGLNIIRDGGE